MKQSNGTYKEAIGVCTKGDSKGLDYFIAIPTDLKTTPKGFELYQIPKSTFAVFHFIGPLHETMPKAEKMIFTEWMPTLGYEPVMTADLEVYSKKPHDAQDYEFWVYVPIKKTT
jgi:AraC family transcriptional regulator